MEVLRLVGATNLPWSVVDHAAKVERVRRALERDIAQETELFKRKETVRGRLERHGVTGLEFVTQLSAGVRSVAAGHVVFADRYDAYGLTVIVDHGDRYYSVYANLGGTDARVGDLVAAGARIGTSSSSGKDEAVYFEIRRGSVAEDPGPWLGM